MMNATHSYYEYLRNRSLSKMSMVAVGASAGNCGIHVEDSIGLTCVQNADVWRRIMGVNMGREIWKYMGESVGM